MMMFIIFSISRIINPYIQNFFIIFYTIYIIFLFNLIDCFLCRFIKLQF